MSKNSESDDLSELKWVTISDTRYTSFPEKFKSKFFENPFVFAGCAATVAALSMGLYNFYKANSPKQQKMMRLRVLAQGCTLVALGVGVMISQAFKDEK